MVDCGTVNTVPSLQACMPVGFSEDGTETREKSLVLPLKETEEIATYSDVVPELGGIKYMIIGTTGLLKPGEAS